jgi:hypothetical protein
VFTVVNISGMLKWRKPMSVYEISFEVSTVEPIDEVTKWFHDRFEGSLSERSGAVFVSVEQEANNALSAAKMAIQLLESGGRFRAQRVDIDVVDAPEIGLRLEVTRQAVCQWAKGQRGRGFPQPVGQPGGKRLWTWGQIVEWAEKNNKRPADVLLTLNLDEISLVNALLAERRLARRPKSNITEMIGRGESKPEYAKSYQENRLGLAS